MWFLKRRIKTPIDDAGRDASIDTKKAGASLRAAEYRIQQEKMEMRWEVEKAELKAKLQDIQDAFEPKDEGNADVMLMSLLSGMGGGLPSGVSSSTPQTPNTATTSATLLTLSDEEICNVIDKFERKHIKLAAKLPASMLLPQVRQRLPGYDEDTYIRAVQLLQERA